MSGVGWLGGGGGGGGGGEGRDGVMRISKEGLHLNVYFMLSTKFVLPLQSVKMDGSIRNSSR